MLYEVKCLICGMNGDVEKMRVISAEDRLVGHQHWACFFSLKKALEEDERQEHIKDDIEEALHGKDERAYKTD